MVVDTKKLLNLFEMFLLVPHLKEKILSVPHMMNHMSIHLSVTVSMVCKAFEWDIFTEKTNKGQMDKTWYSTEDRVN